MNVPARPAAPLRRFATGYAASFRGLSRGAWALAAVCLVQRCGTMVLPFLTLYLVEQRGFSVPAAGGTLTLYGIGSAVGSLAGGWLTDRAGTRVVQAASLAAAAATLLMLGQLAEPRSIVAGVFVLGLVGDAFRPANSAAFVEVVSIAELPRAYGLRRLAINLGMTIGPSVGGLLALRDYVWLFRVNAAACAAAAVLLLVLLPAAGRTANDPRASPAAIGGSAWRDLPFLAVIGLTTGLFLVLFQFLGMYPLALKELHGLDEASIGALYALNTLLIVALEMQLVARLSTRDPLRTIALGALLVGLGFALLPFGRGWGWAAVGVLVWTAGEMLSTPFLEAIVGRRTEGRRRGGYFALFTLAFSVAVMIAPGLGSLVYARFPAWVLWVGCGGLGALLAAGFLAVRPHWHADPRPG